MELRHLRYFKAVAELLNFSRAAERLRVAQPALSRQIRALEEELRTPLFLRERGVQLTDAGRVFYTHTCRILAQVDIAGNAAREAAGGVGGELVICNDWRLGGQFVPAAVAEFHRRFPQVDVSLRDLRSHDQLAAIRSRRAHLGFVVRGVVGRTRDLEILPVIRARLMAVVPARHPSAAQKTLRLADLARESWVVLDEKEAPGYRAFLNQLCRLSGFTPAIEQTATTPEGLIGRVASGYGVAIILEANAPHHNQLVRVLALDVEPIELCAVWHRRETSRLLHAFLDLVRQHVSEAAAPVAKNSRPRSTPAARRTGPVKKAPVSAPSAAST